MLILTSENEADSFKLPATSMTDLKANKVIAATIEKIPSKILVTRLPFLKITKRREIINMAANRTV